MLQTKQLLQRILQENDELYQAQREAVRNHNMYSLSHGCSFQTVLCTLNKPDDEGKNDRAVDEAITCYPYPLQQGSNEHPHLLPHDSC